MIDILIHAKNVKYFSSVDWKYWKNNYIVFQNVI
jgi:hypothetical protein